MKTRSQWRLSSALFHYLSIALVCIALGILPASLQAEPQLYSPASSSPDSQSDDPLQLASAGALPQEQDIRRYWVSEKLDGVRGRWTGSELLTRNGNKISAPDWFIESFPKDMQLDGELWAGRELFEWTSGVVRSHGGGEEWRKLRFMVFDTPIAGLSFDERLTLLHTNLTGRGEYLALIPQQKFDSREGLLAFFNTEVANGAEGLMLHRGDAHYRDGRNSLLVKLKPLNDAEGEVIGYRPGKGTLEGLMGSLRLRLKDGTEFYLGTGFDLQTRRQPPALGSWVTFQYQGLTDKGKPKGARFVRVRPPE